MGEPVDVEVTITGNVCKQKSVYYPHHIRHIGSHRCKHAFLNVESKATAMHEAPFLPESILEGLEHCRTDDPQAARSRKEKLNPRLSLNSKVLLGQDLSRPLHKYKRRWRLALIIPHRARVQVQPTLPKRDALSQELQVASVEAVSLLGADVGRVADAVLGIGGIV